MDLDSELFAWLGDCVYADTTDMSVMADIYRRQLAHPEYQKFIGEVPVIGIWDDHDYGKGDGGKEYVKRQESQGLFLDFIGEPMTTARRTREGIYTSYDVGPMGQQVRFILLDLRYHREAPGPQADILGSAQWAWLDHQLTTSQAQVNVILSSVSVLSPKLPGAEQWQNFPTSYRKLFQVIERSNAKGVLFLTGDRHFGAMLGRSVGSHRYYELMSSGLNKAMTSGLTMSLLRSVYGASNSVFEDNFGLLEFDWTNAAPEITFSVQGVTRPTGLKKKFVMSDGRWLLG